MMACIGDCYDLGPPPDMILSMPPPPLPSFLLPRSAIVSLTANDSQPCFAAFMCEQSGQGPREHSGIEFVELSHKGMGVEDTWLFVLISSCVGVLLLGAILAMILMKCRESYNYSYHDTSKPPMPVIGEPHLTPAKPHGSYLAGTMFYPNQNHALQQQLAHDNRMLWAALTPHGTRHFVTDPYQEDHYEVVDYSDRKSEQPTPHHTINRTPVKSSFDNSGFVDYDYEDPTPLIESYHNNLDEIDMDSGYQEPQEVMGTLSRGSPRPRVSSPTRIEHPNIAPLNLYPHHRSTHNTLNKKSTLSRRISDVSSTSYGGGNV